MKLDSSGDWQTGTHDARGLRRTREPRAPAPLPSRRACPAAPPPSTPHRCGSPQELAQPGRAVRRRCQRPAHLDHRRSAAQLDYDLRRRDRRGALHRDRNKCCVCRHRTRCGHGRRRDRRLYLGALGRDHPATQQVCVQPVIQCHRGNRYPGLAAGGYNARLELIAVPATPSPIPTTAV